MSRSRFQVDFRSYAKLLFFLEAPPAPDDTFLVLGHGVGTCVVASALLYNMRHIQGVDIMQVRATTQPELSVATT